MGGGGLLEGLIAGRAWSKDSFAGGGQGQARVSNTVRNVKVSVVQEAPKEMVMFGFHPFRW